MEVSLAIVERQFGNIIGSRSVIRFIRSFLMLLYVSAGSAAFAQSSQIPQDLLDLDYQRCVNDCVPGFGEATCKPLCECTVGEFKQRLSFDEYLELSVQLTKGEISDKNRTLLDNIAQMCTKKIEEKGIEIGEPVSGQPEPGQPEPEQPVPAQPEPNRP